MNVVDVNAFIALLEIPPGVVEVSRYLTAAGRALRLRSDSELARMIGVAPSVLASWKMRGSVPDKYSDWFRNNLIPKIISRNDEISFASPTARAAFIELIARTYGNPLQVERFKHSVNASMFSPMLATAEFLAELEGINPATLNSSNVERIADLLQGAVPVFQRSLNPEIL